MHKYGQPKAEIRIDALADDGWEGAPVWLIGIDDTDNLESRGTGFRARQLAQQLQSRGLARVRGVTRHQLFVSPDIPYTSHNSAACLNLQFADRVAEDVRQHARAYLLRESADGADAGLCLARMSHVPPVVTAFGRAAKERVLTQADALGLAATTGIVLEGLTGTRQGVIGALAAVGLHAARDDGRFLWSPGIRDLAPGVYTLDALRAITTVEIFRALDGREITAGEAPITITEWARPVLTGGRSVLLLEEDVDERADGERWRVAAKEHIKRH